jgi:hypothetical protein
VHRSSRLTRMQLDFGPIPIGLRPKPRRVMRWGGVNESARFKLLENSFYAALSHKLSVRFVLYMIHVYFCRTIS